MFYALLPVKYNLHVKSKLFVTAKLTWIQIRMDPHWVGSLDPDLEPYRVKSWIRIRIETNADPLHNTAFFN
jgi:hypothetical protein